MKFIVLFTALALLPFANLLAEEAAPSEEKKVAVEEKVVEAPASVKEVEASDWEKKVAIGGQIRIRPEFLDNRDFNSATNDRQDFVGSRMRLNVEVQPIEELKAFVQPQFSGAWGQLETSVNASGVAATGGATSGALNDRNLSLHQGYIVWQMNDKTSFKAGRQELIYGDHLVIGDVGYSNVGRSFDAAKFRYGLSSGTVDLFYSRLAENDVNGPGLSGNDDFAGLYAAFKELGAFDQFDVYGLWLRRAKNTGPAAFNFGTFGTRIKADYHGFDGRFEGGVQLGKMAGQTMFAYMFDIEEGYTFDLRNGLRAALEYNLASGDDPATSKFTRWHSLFPTAHRWFGYMDFLGRQNVQSGVFHLKLKYDANWTFAMDFHSFWRVKSQDLIYGLAAEGAVAGQGAAPANGKKHIGEEVDLVANYAVNKNIGIQAVGAVFLPGAYVDGAIGTDLSYFSYLQGTFNF